VSRDSYLLQNRSLALAWAVLVYRIAESQVDDLQQQLETALESTIIAQQELEGLQHTHREDIQRLKEQVRFCLPGANVKLSPDYASFIC